MSVDGCLNLFAAAEDIARHRVASSNFGGLLPGEKVADLFCGAGGWDEAAKMLGMGSTYSVDRFSPSTNIKDAFKVIDHLNTNCWSIEINNFSNGTWEVRAGSVSVWDDASLPKAISIAALLAFGTTEAEIKAVLA